MSIVLLSGSALHGEVINLCGLLYSQSNLQTSNTRKTMHASEPAILHNVERVCMNIFAYSGMHCMSLFIHYMYMYMAAYGCILLLYYANSSHALSA